MPHLAIISNLVFHREETDCLAKKGGISEECVVEKRNTAGNWTCHGMLSWMFAR